MIKEKTSYICLIYMLVYPHFIYFLVICLPNGNRNLNAQFSNLDAKIYFKLVS